MNEKIMNKKLNVEELTMVNGGGVSVSDILQAGKILWGLYTGDPEAEAIANLLDNVGSQRKSKC